MVDSLIGKNPLNGSNLSQCYELPLHVHHGNAQDIVNACPLAPRNPKVYGNGLCFPINMGKAYGPSTYSHANRLCYQLIGDSRPPCLFPVNLYLILVVVIINHRINVNNALRLPEDLFNLLCNPSPHSIILSVNLCRENGENRRAGGNLNNLHVCPRVNPPCNLLNPLPLLLCNVVGLPFPLMLVNQVYPYIGYVAAPPQVVVSHKAVKVKGGCRSHVSLKIRYLGNR